MQESLKISGWIQWKLYDSDWNLKAEAEGPNILTNVGAQYYAGRAALSSSLPPQVTGFRLGTGTATPAKTGAGAAIGNYLPGSNKPPDPGYPSVANGIVTWQRTFGAGEGTSLNPITEAVLNTDNIGNDNATTATAANTIARALISPSVPNKAASDILVLTWTHTISG